MTLSESQGRDLPEALTVIGLSERHRAAGALLLLLPTHGFEHQLLHQRVTCAVCTFALVHCSAVALLKFSIIFKQEALYLFFALVPPVTKLVKVTSKHLAILGSCAKRS